MRTKIAAITATAALALTLGACGSDDPQISSADRTQASAAALEYVGGGAVTDAARGEGDDGFAYEVEVTLPGGTDIDVELDDSFAVTNNPPKAADFASAPPADPAPADPASATPAPADPSTITRDDDLPLTGSVLTKASAAALKATGSGTVVSTNGSNDGDHVYEVDILLPNGQDVTVELDAGFTVTRIDR